MSENSDNLRPYTIDVHIGKKFTADPRSKFRKKDEPSSGRVELDLEYA